MSGLLHEAWLDETFVWVRLTPDDADGKAAWLAISDRSRHFVRRFDPCRQAIAMTRLT